MSSSSRNRFFLFAALLAGLLAISACGGEEDSESGNTDAETADLLVCSFNIRYIEPKDGEYAWEYRKDAVCNFILKRKPDLIGLQEVEKESAEYILSKVGDEYGFYCIGPTTGKDILVQADPSSANAVLFLKSRFSLSDKGVFWHSDTPDQVAAKNKANDYGSWHTTHPLNTVWMKLTDNEDLGRAVWLFKIGRAHV